MRVCWGALGAYQRFNKGVSGYMRDLRGVYEGCVRHLAVEGRSVGHELERHRVAEVAGLLGACHASGSLRTKTRAQIEA